MRTEILSAFPYFGGKAALTQTICEMLDYSCERFIEPFGGGARVLLNKPRHALEIYNDASAGLCAFMRCMSDPQKAQEVIDRLYDTQYDPETFYSAVQLRNEVEDDYFDEDRRQLKLYLKHLEQKYSDPSVLDLIEEIRRNLKSHPLEMDLGPLKALSGSTGLSTEESMQLTQFYGGLQGILDYVRPIYDDELNNEENFNQIFNEVTRDYLTALSTQVKKLIADKNIVKANRLRKTIQAIQGGKLSEARKKKLAKMRQDRIYSIAYRHSLNNHDSSTVDDISLAVATWIVYTMSRDGMGGAFSTNKFKTQEQYQARIGKLYEVAERMEGVQVSQVGALLYLQRCNYLNDPNVCFYLDPSYLDPEDESKNLGKAYKLSSEKQDHETLLQLIQGAQAKIVISNYDVPLYNQYLQASHWKKYEIDTTTSVGGVSGNYRKEVIWKNF